MRNGPSTAAPVPERRELVADAAIVVLGTEGARGLTHRSVDRAAGLATGSTSNIFRTREDLLVGALDRLIAGDFLQLPEPGSGGPTTLAAAGDQLAELLARWLDPAQRARLVARYELLVESSRRPAFARALAERREQIAQRAEVVMQDLGSRDPVAQARSLVIWIDGLLLDSVVSPDSPAYEPERLRMLLLEQLRPWR